MSDPIAERHAAYTQRIRELEAERDELRALLRHVLPHISATGLGDAIYPDKRPAQVRIDAALLKRPRR